ncbi:MAG: hypothetical protein ACI9WS_001894 [Paraglaciecola psychrophila]|jgi:hypothetical protein
MLYRQWIEGNRKITYEILNTIRSLPTPVKTILSIVPGFNIASNYSDYHKFAIIELAKMKERDNELSAGAKRHLLAYERALENEQRAYSAFIKDFKKDI